MPAPGQGTAVILAAVLLSFALAARNVNSPVVWLGYGVAVASIALWLIGIINLANLWVVLALVGIVVAMANIVRETVVTD